MHLNSTGFRSWAGMRVGVVRWVSVSGMGVRVPGWYGTGFSTGARGDVRTGKRGDRIVETEACFKVNRGSIR